MLPNAKAKWNGCGIWIWDMIKRTKRNATGRRHSASDNDVDRFSKIVHVENGELRHIEKWKPNNACARNKFQILVVDTSTGVESPTVRLV